MGVDKRQEAFASLLEQAEKQGYVTFDYIMDCADRGNLPIQDVDWLSNAIVTRGILVYDEEPERAHKASGQEEDYDDYAQSDYDDVFERAIKLEPSLRPFILAVKDIVPPQYKELNQLKYQVKEGNIHARNRMIEMYLRMAVKIAVQRAETYQMDIVDAIGEACVGLIIAVDKYDSDSNGSFISYASMWILQNLARKQPTQRPLMYYPFHKKELYFMAFPLLKDQGCVECKEIFICPQIREQLYKELSFTDEQIEDVLSGAMPFDSFEEYLSMFLENNHVFQKHENIEDEIEEEEIVPKELIVENNADKGIISLSMQEQLRSVLETLTEKEKKVLGLRYGLFGGKIKTLEEIGKEFHVTRERVRQIETKAMQKLSQPFVARRLKDYL
ncbi:MAG: sigma-70 family RNA polymerase sigma factor [Lachnospiraceae bacterium]|jgi:RNA polymerase primary sigma factor|nr:sigma-70 family RNA polymerase sigma factor [Lachnospiraceae bacterium]